MRRSKRPGRSRAGSRMSGRLWRHEITLYPYQSRPSRPASVEGLLTLIMRTARRRRAGAYCINSSTKTMHGEWRLAWSNRSRTRLAPTPRNLYESEPRSRRRAHRFAGDGLASSVLLSWRANSNTPWGCVHQLNELLRLLQELNHFLKFILDSSMPATSSNVTVGCSPLNMAPSTCRRPWQRYCCPGPGGR